MRVVIGGLAVLAGVSVAAAQPVSTQPLAANEVLAQTVGVGTATRSATSARLMLQIFGRGSTSAEGRQDLRARSDGVAAALQRLGIATADIGRDVGGTALGFVGNIAGAVPDDDEPPAISTMTGGPDRRRTAVALMSILIRDIGLVDRAVDAAQEAGAGTTLPVTYRLDDDRAAQVEARGMALREARQQAEGYAATLGMRVARLVRVSEGPDSAGGTGWTVYAGLVNAMSGEVRRGEVQTRVIVSADFALAPR